jgi:hypothetical protein
MNYQGRAAVMRRKIKAPPPEEVEEPDNLYVKIALSPDDHKLLKSLCGGPRKQGEFVAFLLHDYQDRMSVAYDPLSDVTNAVALAQHDIVALKSAIDKINRSFSNVIDKARNHSERMKRK